MVSRLSDFEIRTAAAYHEGNDGRFRLGDDQPSSSDITMLVAHLYTQSGKREDTHC
jgi:hypothetical protein